MLTYWMIIYSHRWAFPLLTINKISFNSLLFDVSVLIILKFVAALLTKSKISISELEKSNLYFLFNYRTWSGSYIFDEMKSILVISDFMSDFMSAVSSTKAGREWSKHKETQNFFPLFFTKATCYYLKCSFLIICRKTPKLPPLLPSIQGPGACFSETAVNVRKSRRNFISC